MEACNSHALAHFRKTHTERLPIPKLTDSCLLVSLSISSFSGKRTDKKLTSEISNTHNTKGDALRVVKRLVSDSALETVKKLESAARVYHRENTVPWLDDGQRMLPSRHHMKYMAEMSRIRGEFEGAASDFVAAWPATVTQAKIDLNGTFNAADYPDVQTIQFRFKFRVGCAPVPDGGDIRVDLPAEDIKAIREELDDRIKEAEQLVKGDLYRRLAEPLVALVDRLSDKDSTFRNSLVTNIRDIVDLIPSLDVTGDPNLERIRLKIRQELANERPDDLRDNKLIRSAAVGRAQSILAMMEPLMPLEDAA